MARKKNKQPMGKPFAMKQSNPGLSPQAAQQVQEYVNGVIYQLSQRIVHLAEQLTATQELLLEVNPEFTLEKLGAKLVNVIDRGNNLREVTDRPAEKGDTVRITIGFKADGAEELSNSSPWMVPNLGSGNTFVASIEEAIIGMKVSDVVQVPIETGGSYQIKLDRISCPIEVADANKDAR